MMKNNKTESEIFDQIKESLERYEEAYIPGSWENFLDQRRSNNRKIYLRIASGIAACLIVGFLGISYFQSDNREQSVVTAEQSAKAFGEKPVAENSFAAKAQPSAAVAGSAVQQPRSAVAGVPEISYRKNTLRSQRQEKTTREQPDSAPAAKTTEQAAVLPAGKKSPSADKKTATEKSSSDTIPGKKESPDLISPQMADNQQLASAQKRKIRFGVNFSPGVITSESSGSLNYTGGISADIPLSQKVAISTGVQVENQSFVTKMPGIVSSANAPVNQTKTTLTNLDLPVNITWKFAAVKTHAYYVSAGLSSLVYLSQENKNTTYTQDLIPVSSLVNGEEIKSYSIVSDVSVTQEAVDPVQTFDLAGRINLMVGFETQLSKRIYLHFEPYAKIPTSSQAAGSLNHTTTGVNFKISF